MTLQKFIEQEREAMLRALKWTVRDCQRMMRVSPEEHTEHGCDEPSIDVRLCVDLDNTSRRGWIFRTGSVDYDPYHSQYCSASSIQLDTLAKNLLSELIGGLDG